MSPGVGVGSVEGETPRAREEERRPRGRRRELEDGGSHGEKMEHDRREACARRGRANAGEVEGRGEERERALAIRANGVRHTPHAIIME